MAFFEFAVFSVTDVSLVILALILFSILSHLKKSLSVTGIFVGNIVGLIIFLLGGITSFLVIVTFFIVAEFSTSYSRKKINKKHEQRTPSNIIGNSGAAIIALLFSNTIGFFGAMASALSDTVSSEIGMLAKKKPRLITNFKEVKTGTDGGITPIGLIAGIIGAAIIAGIYFYFTSNSTLFIILIIAGFVGSLVDSFLGAIFERKGQLNNTQVNFIASLSGGVVAVLLSSMF